MSKTSKTNQILATLSCNIISFSFGASLSFATCGYVLWTSDKTPLPSGKLTVFEASLVTSLMCIGCLAGNLFFVSLSAKFGRKIPLLFLAMPQIVNLTLFYIATNVYYLYVARFLTGVVGGGAYILIPIYVSEIADDSVRGMLGSALTLSCNSGIMFGFVVGSYLEYFNQLKVLILVPIAFLLTFHYFPETPEFLRQQQKKNMAEKSLSFFQGIKYVPNLQELDEEKQPMKMDEKVVVAEEPIDAKLSLSDFLKPAAKKALLIGVIMSMGNILCGAWPLMTYTQTIFEEVGSSLSPDMCAVIVSIVQVVANILTIVIVDHFGRKKLYSLSATCTGLGLVALALQSAFKEQLTEYAWISVIVVSFVIFTSSCGVLPLHYVILVEIMPKRIQSVANLTCMTVLWGMASIVLQIYPAASKAYGLHTCMLFFATACFLLTIFTMFVTPETRGKSHETIMRELQNEKS